MRKTTVKKCLCGLAAVSAGIFASQSLTCEAGNFTVPIRSGSSIHFVWVGDLNGDGKPDYVLDRNTDNYQKIEAYTDSGQFLWDVNFGPNSVNKDNISPGSATIDVGHWDGVTVGDVNNDGKAEVIIKIANGVRFGDGTTWNNSSNWKQWIGVLEGRTGRLLSYQSVPQDYLSVGPLGCHMGLGSEGIYTFFKNRNPDKSFNQLACVYYMSGGSLKLKWSKTGGGATGHQIRICDVNGDGADDLCQIGYVRSGKDGNILYNINGIVHGDRWHIGKLDPYRYGLQGYGIQQDNYSGLHEYYYNANNGSMIWTVTGAVADLARGDVGDVDPTHAGYECWSFDGLWNSHEGTKIADNAPYPVLRLWWDTDDLSEQFNDGKIEKWYYGSSGVGRLVSTWNYDSATRSDRGCPMFYGDFLGDWREEVVLANLAFDKLVVFTPDGWDGHRNSPTKDRYYRNCLTVKGYMQSHLTSYYLGAFDPSTTFYSFKNRATGKYIDGMGRPDNGSACGQWGESVSYNQDWILEYVSGTSGQYYLIRNRGTGRCLDSLGRSGNGEAAGQWDSGWSWNQQWALEQVDGYYKLRNRATGLYLDGMGRTGDGSDLGMYAGSGSWNQQWIREQL